MTTQNQVNDAPAIIPQFTNAKQFEFFESLKQKRFSGQLLLTEPKGKTWVFYLYLGRIMYATGGIHLVRRWRRNLAIYFPQLLVNFSEVTADLSAIAAEGARFCWEYQLLSVWIDQQKITREQANSMTKGTVVEILFDLTQVTQLSYELRNDNLMSTRLLLIDSEQVIAEASELWQTWQAAKVADRSPDTAPLIKQPEQLQQRTNAQVYQNLSQLLDGQQTLRDLAVRMKRDLVTVTRSLLPYLQLGLVQLVEVPDIPAPVSTPIAEMLSKSGVPKRTLIACVDDSPQICHMMEKVVTNAGYQFIGENDGLRAIAVLLSRKPDLIFLDLVMPNTNGYEICSQLRKLSYFRNVPIVILTGNDGIVDRVRAKMVGSTDFMSKPINSEVVLGAIEKYLKQKV